MSQIALVTDKHNNNVGVGMVAQLLQPSGDVLVGLVLADVVNEEGTDGATVVGGCDGAVTLLAGSIPNLGLDRLGVDLDRTGGELDTDGGLGVEVELVAGESAQKVRLANAGVSDQDDCRLRVLARGRWQLRCAPSSFAPKLRIVGADYVCGFRTFEEELERRHWLACDKGGRRRADCGGQQAG